MTWLRSRWLPLTVLVAAVATLTGTIAVTTGAGRSWWPTGAAMMGQTMRVEAPVRTLDDAAHAADQYGQRWDLHAGEVMRFDNGFYAELLDPTGAGATEVLIDDATGTVGPEHGPAMMWNTRYGPHPVRAARATIGPEQAHAIAQAWLADNRPSEQASAAEAFPGYYTLHTLRDGALSGMLSVHATTGAVWYHAWHGRFLDMREPTD